jgi:hypothetical protein
MRAGLIVAAVLSTSCASAQPPAPPPVPAATVVPGFETSVETVDIQALADEARDPASLVALLEDEGFASGRQRTFANPKGEVRLVVARVLRFEYDAGAEAYVRWLQEHASDRLGSVEAIEPPAIPCAFAVAHTPGGCCPNKDMSWYLAAWTRDGYVLSLLIGGSEADPAFVDELSAELDAVV